MIWIVCCIAVCCLLACTIAASKREAKARADGTYARRYVYVEDDGRVRSLTEPELTYLNQTFHPTDGGRPYIKRDYRALTPDGRMSGFLLRRKLPPSLVAGMR